MNLKNVFRSGQTLAWYTAAMYLAFVLTLLTAYFDLHPIEAISWIIKDEWCEIGLEGLGNHCFGDYYYPLTLANLTDPWVSSRIGYPPLALAMWKPFILVEQLIPGKTGLALFTAASWICSIFPVLHQRFIVNKLSNGQAAFGILVISVCTPVIVTIDRGNNQLFILPLFYLLLISYLNCEYKKTAIYLAALVMLKPQIAIFGLLLLKNRRYKELATSALISSFAIFLSFGLYWGNFFSAMGNWFRNLIAFQDYAPPGSIVPVNLSITNSLEIASKIFQGSLSHESSKQISAIVGIVALLIWFSFAKAQNKMKNILFVCFFLLSFAGTTFHYYLALLLVPLALYYFNFEFGKSQETIESLGKNKALRTFIAVIALSAFIPWSLPWGVIAPFSDEEFAITGMNWMFVAIFIPIATIYLVADAVLERVRQTGDR